MLYIEEPDEQSHMYGPDAIQVSLSAQIIFPRIEIILNATLLFIGGRWVWLRQFIDIWPFYYLQKVHMT